MKEYINLNIRNCEDNRSACLDDAIQAHNIIILLGAPGNGKTSLLRKYETENKDICQFIEVKRFLKRDSSICYQKKVILLDALDEYRSISSDKEFALTELGIKLNQLQKTKIVISCREMDWYGEADEVALKDEINRDVEVFYIEALNYEQKLELAQKLKIIDPNNFIDRFSNYGFLDNPQMFVMLANLYSNNKTDSINTKKDLYHTFVINAREQNPKNIINKVNELEPEEILKYAGYLASFNIFSGIDTFETEIIDQVCDSKNNYPKEKLEKVLNTALFSHKKFIHRTIAEFSSAYYLSTYKLTDNSLSSTRIKDLFVNNKKIPTDLRGTYAWLCSLSANDCFIAIDPYYQAIHGDNSFFDNELKKKIVIQVKQHAKNNPYFFKFGQTMELEGFYNDDLDSFFISEFYNAVKQKNHYIDFIINAIVSTPFISEKMREFLKNKIMDKELRAHLKSNILESKAFSNETQFMLEILDKIKNTIILDKDNTIKEAILQNLYPRIIKPKDVAKYLMLYNKCRIIGQCHYLFLTPYNEKFQLVDQIHALSYNEKESPKLSLNKSIKYFIEDYFLETLLMFQEGLSAKDIYETLTYFKNKYYEYNPMRFNSYRNEINDELKKNEIKLSKLATELFSFYINDDELFSKRFLFFRDCFGLETPKNANEIILNLITNKNNIAKNKELFCLALNYSPKDTPILPKLEIITKTFGFEEYFDHWQKPKKQEWEIEEENEKIKEEEEKKREFEKNEIFFSNKTDNELQQSFNILYSIASYMFIDEEYREKYFNISKDTFTRLKRILKNAIWVDLIAPELLTLKSLAENSPDARRNIDRVYYVSCCINNKFDFKTISNDFLKYLYINSIIQQRVSNIIKGNFIDSIEIYNFEYDFITNTLIEYITCLLEAHLSEVPVKIVKSYIDKDKDKNRLKKIAVLSISENQTIADTILNSFLRIYNFGIDLKDLLKIKNNQLNEDNKNTVFGLMAIQGGMKNNFTVKMAVSLYKIFQYENFCCFSSLPENKKVDILNYMLDTFNTEESIVLHNGYQSDKAQCASFLRHGAIESLNNNELQLLQNKRITQTDIWTNRIANELSQNNQINADKIYNPYGIEKIKHFLLSEAIISNNDFFADICAKIELLKKEIEDNRNNDKKLFYGQNRPKNENDCRDVILLRLKDKYGNDIDIIKEKFEAENRVDINIRYRANQLYEVQVECKKDDNANIKKGITNQLIDKYMGTGAKFGIYLVFIFNIGKKNNIEILHNSIKAIIPSEYKKNIKVICIDLTNP